MLTLLEIMLLLKKITFFFSKKPNTIIYCLHSLQGQSVGFHCFIAEFPKTLQLFHFIWHELPYFWSKIFDTLCTIKNCLYRRDMKFRSLSKIKRYLASILKNDLNNFGNQTTENFKHFIYELLNILVVDRDRTVFFIIPRHLLCLLCYYLRSEATQPYQ